MSSISTRYSMYFNKKYKRVGPLFQGAYKAVMVTTDEYLLHLSRYIHLNATEITANIANYYSSFANYLGFKEQDWINTHYILDYFKAPSSPFLVQTQTYKKFVESELNNVSNKKITQNSADYLGDLTLE